MISGAIYLLKVMCISGVLFGYYTLALRNERFHEWNRYYLVLSALLSLVLPFARWSALFSAYRHTEPLYVARLQAFTLAARPAAAGGLSWTAWPAILYALVVLSLVAALCAGLLKIRRRIRQGTIQRFPLFTLVHNRQDESPFSFFHYIFWNDRISPGSREGNQIMHHELVHVREKHSLDKLLMELILALFWINPFFHLIRRELHMIHEFIADRRSCLNRTARVSPQEYAALLVRQSLRSNNITFASHFFQKQLTRRVHMLIRENKAHFTWLKRVMAVPLALFVMLFFLFLQSKAKENDPLLKDVSDMLSQTSPAPILTVFRPPAKAGESGKPGFAAKGGNTKGGPPVPAAATAAKPSIAPPRIKGKVLPDFPSGSAAETRAGVNGQRHHVFGFVEQMPSFPGGAAALMKYLHDHVRYPRAAVENGIQGTVAVQFVVNTSGRLTHIITTGPAKGGGLEEEAVSVVKNMPRWIPGRQNGHKVNVRYTLPVRFVMEGQTFGLRSPMPPAVPLKTNTRGKVFTFVEQMPSFPGGERALMKYLHDHIRYPADARENGIQGTIVVQFIVNRDGSLSDISTVGPRKGGGLEEEALRVVKNMSGWQPGMQNGKTVAVQYSLPIRFVLQ